MSLMNYGFTKSPLATSPGLKNSPESPKKSKDKTPLKSPSQSPQKKKFKESEIKSKPKKESPKSPSTPKLPPSTPKQLPSPKKESPKSPSTPKSPPSTPKQLSSPKKESPKSPSTPKSPPSTPKQLPSPKISPKSSSPAKSQSPIKLNIPMENQLSHSPEALHYSPFSQRGSSDLSLPPQRIKMIMKSCPEVEVVPQESLHVITKATELFIQHVAFESIKSSENKSKLDYESLSNLIHSRKQLEFLKETIPKKLTLEECQKIIAYRNKNRLDEMV